MLFQDKYHNVTNPRHKFARIHRADLQKALLNKLPPSIIHLKKRVIGVDASNKEEVTVYFEDSTSIKADLVIGADGIKSVGCLRFFDTHVQRVYRLITNVESRKSEKRSFQITS